jgi:membrane fusion protein, multidrug efflux system
LNDVSRDQARRPISERSEPAQRHAIASGARQRLASARQAVQQHSRIAAAIAVVTICALLAGLLWWLHARNFESTDDAFIDARPVPISAQVGAQIIDVPVGDNQLVDAGVALIRLDQRDYQAALSQATAQRDQAQASILNFQAQIEAQQARVGQANNQVTQTKAALTFAQQEDVRTRELLSRGADTQQHAQQTGSNLRQAQASYDGAEANYVAADKQVSVLRTQKQVAEAQLEQAQASVQMADANLTRTEISAPTSGRATKISAATGAYVQPGQTVMMFVPRDTWITANFKETQLTFMRPGQPVSVSIDAYPDRTFQARVDSIQAGSGAAFSLLPPENATGNYVKVVQRVPVKIVFDQTPDVYLGPGMSVMPTVQVR